MTQNIDQTLAERGSRYGEFDEHARITQNMKSVMADSLRWAELPDDMRECLEMVAHKVGRILNGDPQYIDSWTDIIGYTRLVEKRLIAEQSTAKLFAFPTTGGASDHAADGMAAGSALKGTDTAPKTATETVADDCECIGCMLRRSGLLVFSTKRA